MKYVVQRGAYLRLSYQEPQGRQRWRMATTVNGDVVPDEVPVEALAPFIASGHVCEISDEEAARLPRPTNPLHALILGRPST